MQEGTDKRTLAGHLNEWTGDGPVWCPRATVKAESASDLLIRGHKHFASGARLYMRRIMGYRREDAPPDIEVVGRHRASHRYVRMIIRGSWVENWRADLVYSPKVAQLLWPKWDGTAASKEQAEWYAAFLNRLNSQSDKKPPDS